MPIGRVPRRPKDGPDSSQCRFVIDGCLDAGNVNADNCMRSVLRGCVPDGEEVGRYIVSEVRQAEPGVPSTAAQQPEIKGRLHLFDVAGIKLTIDYSWLIIFLLVIWSLSSGYFPYHFPDFSPGLYWLAGFIATLLFFASIVIHELSHSLTALGAGLKIPEITLFLFGGVAHLSEEPSDPVVELKIAVAGPLASFALAAIFWAIHGALVGKVPTLAVAIVEYLAWINLALAIFNLVPGYPLDGGRILRAVVWWKTGSIAKAAKWASDVGKGFAWALIVLGVVRIFAGSLIGGFWLILIGMFLRGLAATGYENVVVKQALEGVRVNDVMIRDVVSVPPDMSVHDAADQYFLRYGHGGFPVVRANRAVGLICLAGINQVPAEERHSRTVEQVMIPLGESVEIRPDDSLVDAIRKMSETGIGRLLVMQNNSMIGMITKNGLIKFMEIKRLLGS